MGPCLCGDTECPSCGTAQGTREPDAERPDDSEPEGDSAIDGGFIALTMEAYPEHWSPIQCVRAELANIQAERLLAGGYYSVSISVDGAEISATAPGTIAPLSINVSL